MTLIYSIYVSFKTITSRQPYNSKVRLLWCWFVMWRDVSSIAHCRHVSSSTGSCTPSTPPSSRLSSFSLAMREFDQLVDCFLRILISLSHHHHSDSYYGLFKFFLFYWVLLTGYDSVFFQECAFYYLTIFEQVCWSPRASATLTILILLLNIENGHLLNTSRVLAPDAGRHPLCSIDGGGLLQDRPRAMWMLHSEPHNSAMVIASTQHIQHLSQFLFLLFRSFYILHLSDILRECTESNIINIYKNPLQRSFTIFFDQECQ